MSVPPSPTLHLKDVEVSQLSELQIIWFKGLLLKSTLELPNPGCGMWERRELRHCSARQKASEASLQQLLYLQTLLGKWDKNTAVLPPPQYLHVT